MGLREKLKEVEQKGFSSMRRGLGRARGEWADVERRIRRRMRVYPAKLRERMRACKEDERDLEQMDVRLPTGGRAGSESSSTQRKPIISIHGEDIDDAEIDQSVAS